MRPPKHNWDAMAVNESFVIGYSATGIVRNANKTYAPKQWRCRKGPVVNWVVVRVK